MNCRKCGSELAADAKFCPKCATAITVRRWPWMVGIILGAVAVLGTYAAMFILAYAGQPVRPISLVSSLLWTWLLFFSIWKYRGRKATSGSVTGLFVGLIVYLIAVFLSGFQR